MNQSSEFLKTAVLAQMLSRLGATAAKLVSKKRTRAAELKAGISAATAAKKDPTLKQFATSINNKYNSAETAKDFTKSVGAYKDPVHLLSKEDLTRDAAGNLKTILTHDSQKVAPSLKRGVRTTTGNTFHTLDKLTENLEGKGLAGGAWQIAKNFGKVVKSQTFTDMHREIEGKVVSKGGKDFIKSRVSWLPDREILAKTDRGSFIVKKRLGPVSAVVGVNAPSVAIGTYAFSDKKQSQGKRIKDSLVDGALFTVSPPIGIANSLFRESRKKTTQGIKQTNQKI